MRVRPGLSSAMLIILVAGSAEAADLTPDQICLAGAWADVGVTECNKGVCQSRDGNTRTFKVTKRDSNEISISLVRQKDKKKFDYLCRVEGDRVIISGVVDGKPGPRWTNPDRPSDLKKFYRVEGDEILIIDRYSDEPGDETRYALSSL